MAFPSSRSNWPRPVAGDRLLCRPRRGDPVAGVATERGTIRTAPRTRRGVVTECAGLLDAATPHGQVDLGAAMHEAHSARRLVVISDFLGDLAPMLKPARALLGEGGEVIGIHVVAREELEPSSDAILATDPEDADVKRALTRRRGGTLASPRGASGSAQWARCRAHYEKTVPTIPRIGLYAE